jgi:hypothetical protein
MPAHKLCHTTISENKQKQERGKVEMKMHEGNLPQGAHPGRCFRIITKIATVFTAILLNSFAPFGSNAALAQVAGPCMVMPGTTPSAGCGGMPSGTTTSSTSSTSSTSPASTSSTGTVPASFTYDGGINVANTPQAACQMMGSLDGYRLFWMNNGGVYTSCSAPNGPFITTGGALGGECLQWINICDVRHLRPRVSCPPNYSLDPGGMTCSSSDLAVTLTGDTSIEPITVMGAGVGVFTASVKDKLSGLPQAGVPVNLSIMVDSTSGGHDHGDSIAVRDNGKLNCLPDLNPCTGGTTSGSGTVTFVFFAREEAGTYTITADCSGNGCTGPANATVNVEVTGLQPIPASSLYVFTGSNKKHSKNHFLSPDAISALNNIAMAYNAQFPAGPLLHLNDASLSTGGLFDINGNWSSAHKGHRRGAVIDIRANQNPGAIPQARFSDFQNIARLKGANADLHCDKAHGQCLADLSDIRHFHVWLLNKDQ